MIGWLRTCLGGTHVLDDTEGSCRVIDSNDVLMLLYGYGAPRLTSPSVLLHLSDNQSCNHRVHIASRKASRIKAQRITGAAQRARHRLGPT